MGHIHNHSGQEQHNWVIFDNNGNVVKAFDNHIQIEKDQFEAAIFSSTTPAMMSGDAYVKEQYNDTLYRLSPRNELVPAFVFDVGQYSFPLDLFLTQDNLMELYLKSAFISTYTTAESRMVVSRNNIFFDTWIGPNTGISTPAGNTSKKIVWGREIEDSDTNDVLGLYDIQSGKTELLDRDPVTRRMGLVNDIDGGLSFWPKYYNESADELVDVWEAYEMKDLLTEEYFAAHPAKDPAAHERLRALLKNLKETDNPVIVVARLK
jgi:hypothetical protein